MPVRRVGAHLSIAKGLAQAAQTMTAMGGNCLQIFSGSPRGWARKPLDSVDVRELLDYCAAHAFGPVFVHALYLVNFVSESAELAHNSVESLKYDLAFNGKIGGGGVIVHLGSHQGRGFERVFPALAQRLREILETCPMHSQLLIENSAGQNGKLCSNLHEIRMIFDALPHFVSEGKLGWCFDTCHGFAAGYPLDQVEQTITAERLWDRLQVIHLNDSRDPFDSGRDRHANIGEGLMGEETIRRFLHNEKFEHLPLILEVPGFDSKGPDKKNVEIVWGMLDR